MTPEQNCCFGLRNGKGNKKPLSYEKFRNHSKLRSLFFLKITAKLFCFTNEKS